MPSCFQRLLAAGVLLAGAASAQAQGWGNGSHGARPKLLDDDRGPLEQMERLQREYQRDLQARALRAAQRKAQAALSAGAGPAPGVRPTSERWALPKICQGFPRLLDDARLAVLGAARDELLGLDLASGRVDWKASLAGDRSLAGGAPGVAGSRLVRVTEAWDLLLLDPKSGRECRRIPLDPLDSYALLHSGHAQVFLSEEAGGLLVLATFGKGKGGPTGWIYAVNLEAGTLAWKAEFPGGPDLPPFLAQDRVVVGGNGRLEAFALSDGRSLWRADAADTPGPLEDGLLLGDQVAVLCGGLIQTRNLRTGAQTWVLPFRGEPLLLGAGNRLLFLQKQGLLNRMHLVALEAGTGRKAWDRPASPDDLPWIANDRILFSHGDTVTALDLSDGRTAWDHALAGDLDLPLGIGSGTVYAVDRQNGLPYLHGLDLRTGREAWSLAVPHILAQVFPVETAQGLLLTTLDGGLVLAGGPGAGAAP